MPFNGRHITREHASGSGSSGSGGVSGILRKTTNTQSGGVHQGFTNSYNHVSTASALNAGEARQVDLLVFGYACKIFRDDDKARNIDQGKHLIPWMGDNSLKIDRYDVRGALADLAPHEPPPGGYGNRLEYLSAEEQRAEQLCEEERYLFLYNNEEDHILQHEEELKRLKQDCDGGSYNQVGFQYDSGAAADSEMQQQIGPNLEQLPGNDDEQPFVLPKNFEVPIDIQLPDSMKQHAIIEKTARFIATQGVQMEILLKAKQSNNVQFEFLNQDSTLNRYYKFVVNAIKNNTYPAECSTNAAAAASAAAFAQNGLDDAANSAQDMEDHQAKTIITVPTIKYKPSANCAYTQLISKIKGVPLPDVIAAESRDESRSSTNTPTTPVLLQYNGSTYVQAGAEQDESNSMGGVANVNSNSNSNTATDNANLNDSQPQVELLKNSSALALAQNYSSDSESEPENDNTAAAAASSVPVAEPKPEPVLNFPIPTETLKNMIDKTATYVIKNGRQFEETLRTKDEERFNFLVPDNEYYPYYMYKITDDPDAASKEAKKRKAAAVAAALISKKGGLSDKTVSPISFSIKPKDEHAVAGLQPALAQDPSDDDEDMGKSSAVSNQPVARTVPEHVQKAIQLVEIQLMARNAQLAATAAGTNIRAGLVPVGIGAVAGMACAGGTSSSSISTSHNLALNHKSQISCSKAEQERNAIYEQQQQNRQKELKKAEEKVKDKLAQIAREKLGGLLSKEKQLQLERKRKAMAFLNQIKTDSNNSPDLTELNDNNSTDNKIKHSEEQASDADSNASIHSIPITSYGPEDDKSDDDDEQRQRTHSQLLPRIDKPKTLTVTLSDDDDVQLISDTNVIRPSSRSNLRQLSTATTSIGTSSSSTAIIRQTHKNYRKRSASVTSSGSSSSRSTNDEDESRRRERRYPSKSHKSKKSKKSSKATEDTVAGSSSSTKRRKKKSKKHQRSRSRSYSRHRSKSERRLTRSPSSSQHKRERREKDRDRHQRRRSYSSCSVDSMRSSDSRHRYDRKRSHKSSSHPTRHKDKKRDK